MQDAKTTVDAQPDEIDLVRRAVARDQSAIRAIITDHNRRLFRVARAVVRDDGDAEDVLQEAYLKAFASLASFRHDATLSTWLTRIVLNEALQRVRRTALRPTVPLDILPTSADVIPFPSAASLDPERSMAQREFCRLVEIYIDKLPEDFRTVLMLRAVEGLSIEETAALLDIEPSTVKTRLHRARNILKAAVADHTEALFKDAFPFEGWRCERLTHAVMERLHAQSSSPGREPF